MLAPRPSGQPQSTRVCSITQLSQCHTRMRSLSPSLLCLILRASRSGTHTWSPSPRQTLPVTWQSETHLPVCARHHWQSHPPEEPHQQLSPNAGACLEAAFTAKPCKGLPEPCAPLTSTLTESPAPGHAHPEAPRGTVALQSPVSGFA